MRDLLKKEPSPCLVWWSFVLCTDPLRAQILFLFDFRMTKKAHHNILQFNNEGIICSYVTVLNKNKMIYSLSNS